MEMQLKIESGEAYSIAVGLPQGHVDCCDGLVPAGSLILPFGAGQAEWRNPGIIRFSAGERNQKCWVSAPTMWSAMMASSGFHRKVW